MKRYKQSHLPISEARNIQTSVAQIPCPNLPETSIIMLLSKHHFFLLFFTVCLIVTEAACVPTAEDVHTDHLVHQSSRPVSKFQLCSHLFPTSSRVADLVRLQQSQQRKSERFQAVFRSAIFARVSAPSTTNFCTAVFSKSDTIVFSATCDVARLLKAHVVIEHPISSMAVKILLQQSGWHSQLSQHGVSAIQNENGPFAYAKLTRNAPSWVSTVTLSQDSLRAVPGPVLMISGFCKNRKNKRSSYGEIAAGSSKTRPNYWFKGYRGHNFRMSVASTFEECISR